MYIRYSALVAIFISAMFSTAVPASDITIYRWVDENNVVHFSQQLPQDDQYSQLSTFASYKAKQLSESKQLPPVDDQLSDYEKRQKEISDKNKAIAIKNCEAAQLNLKMLNSFDKVTTLDANGKNHVLTDDERKAKVVLSNKHINLYCKSDK